MPCIATSSPLCLDQNQETAQATKAKPKKKKPLYIRKPQVLADLAFAPSFVNVSVLNHGSEHGKIKEERNEAVFTCTKAKALITTEEGEKTVEKKLGTLSPIPAHTQENQIKEPDQSKLCSKDGTPEVFKEREIWVCCCLETKEKDGSIKYQEVGVRLSIKRRMRSLGVETDGYGNYWESWRSIAEDEAGNKYEVFWTSEVFSLDKINEKRRLQSYHEFSWISPASIPQDLIKKNFLIQEADPELKERIQRLSQ